MSDIVIKAENVSKIYWLQSGKKGSLSETISYNFKSIFRKKSLCPTTDKFFALNDVSFEVKKGEAFGIIGKNGAGKSTLLKILSRITEPTSGRIEIDGRLSSLLEVGTGFHPELSGRENIYLNGTILGMTRLEIRARFDEIVAFSGVENFIDTPVKRYSSGMYVRLAFAVAAHLRTEILIIDEVLAVGDVEFQKKCLGKMNEATSEGKTVLLVSHQMAALKQLCTKALLLSNGQVIYNGDTQGAIDCYLNQFSTEENEGELYWTDMQDAPGSKEMHFICMKILNAKREPAIEFDIAHPILIEISFVVHTEINNLRIGIHLLGPDQVYAFVTAHTIDQASPGSYMARCIIPENLLNVNTYYLVAGAGIAGVVDFTKTQTYFKFTTFDTVKSEMILNEVWPGIVKPKLNWKVIVREN